MGSVVSLTSTAVGFDTTDVVSGTYAACAATSHGKSFVGRYVSLTSPEASGDLSSAEATEITENGLAILVVQHCYSDPSFSNYATQGTTDAGVAITNLNAIGAPSGIFVYVDIENFDTAAHAAAYAKAWATKINGDGTYKAGYYGPSNVLGDISGVTWHGLWENVTCFGGALTGANISQGSDACSGGTTLACSASVTIDTDAMLTGLGGFWGY
jgi:hypothetical protein